VNGLTQASAARSGGTLWLDITPFTDSTPGHLGPGYARARGTAVTGRYAVYANGRLAAAGNAARAAAHTGGDLPLQVRLRAAAATIRFVLTAARAGRRLGPPTASRTVWVWRSAPARRARLPHGWFCGLKDPGRNCAAQPMLTLAYTVARLRLDETAPPGPQALDVLAGHVQPGRAVKITSAAVMVSADGGRSWHAASVRRVAAGRFRALFTAPAGARIALRTTATDAAGGSITETITGAYRTTRS
jgi:hypothetical protein